MAKSGPSVVRLGFRKPKPKLPLLGRRLESWFGFGYSYCQTWSTGQDAKYCLLHLVNMVFAKGSVKKEKKKISW